MALVVKDRVKETCTGTNGNFTLAGAVSGYVAFSTVGNSNTTYYAVEDADGTKWEVGLGTLNADSSEIARTTVLSNQAGNTTTQTFSGGTHTIYCVYPADKSVHVGANIDIGSFSFTAETLVSDVSTGTAPITVSSTTKVTNLNADKLDDQEGSYYLDFGNFVIDDDEIPIAKLASDSVSFGGITVALGASDATPAFDLSDATNYPTSSLSGTITNAQLAGSIANAKLANDGITIAGTDTSLGGSITADTIAGQISANTIAFTQIADLARGSILYGNNSAATAELTKGSANTVLQSDGTDISWGTVSNAMLAGSIANAKLANDSVSFGGITVALGASDATPAFDLSDATNYPTSSLSGTITNAQLAGSIANAKLANDSVSFGGITVALGASDATPAFDLADATNYPTSSLSGTITNAQLAGSIANAKLANDSVSFGGITVALGASDATPAFDLSDATNYPTSSLSGTITNAQLAGSIANAKLANSAITVAAGSDSTAISLGGTMTFAGTANEVEVTESSGTVTIGLPSSITADLTGDVTGNVSGTAATVTGGTQASITTVANVVEVGALNAGSITSGFGNIDNGSSSIACGSLDVSDGNITNVGDIDCDSISVADAANGLNIDVSGANNGTAKITLKDNVATALDVTESSNSYMKFTTTDNATRIVTNVGVVGNTTALTSQSGSVVINAALGNYFTVATNGNITGLDIQNAVVGQKILIRFAWGGDHSLAFTDTVIWPGGTAPGTTASGVDMIGFICTTASSAFDGFIVGEDIKSS